MAKIKEIKAREILNGKGEPTIETTVVLNDGKVSISSCPTGSFNGNYEAVELRDHASERFQGRGVLKAVSNVNDVIAPALLGIEATKQQEIDKKMIDLDGTANKGRLGANATLSVSMAVAKAAAASSVLPLFLYLRQFIKKENLNLRIPVPIFNLLNGNKEEDGADFKDFLVVGVSSEAFYNELYVINKVYNSLKNELKTNNLSTLVSDEGGFSPKVSSNEDALSLVKRGIEAVGFRLGYDIFLGLDCSSNNIFREQKYKIKDNAAAVSSSELGKYYEDLSKRFQIIYIEDPFSDEDWDGWSQFTSSVSAQTLVVGDSLIATNPYRLQMALDKKAVTGVVIKPIQIGTVIESLAVVEIARQAGLKVVTSVRTEETNDDFIADFAVAVSSDYIKFGGPARGEMVAKYNRLLEIEKELQAL